MDEQQTPPPPQWSPPPQAQAPAGWGQQGYMAPPARPGGVTFAGVFMIILGILSLIFAAFAFLGTAVVGGAGLGQAGGVFAGIIGFFAIILLIWGLANIIGGAGALQGKSWGRVTGIVVSVIAVVLGALGLLGSLSGGVDASSLIINLVILVGYAYAAWALYQAGSYFAFRR